MVMETVCADEIVGKASIITGTNNAERMKAMVRMLRLLTMSRLGFSLRRVTSRRRISESDRISSLIRVAIERVTMETVAHRLRRSSDVKAPATMKARAIDVEIVRGDSPGELIQVMAPVGGAKT